MRLGEIVLAQAQLAPDRNAVIFRDEPTSYGELAASITDFAAGLLEIGIVSGDRIALLLPNCPPFLIGYYGATIIDVVVVPANPLLKAPELEYIWSDAAIRMVITIPQLLPVVQAARAGLSELKHVVCIAPRADCGPTEFLSSVSGFMTLEELMLKGGAALAKQQAILSRGPADEDSCAVIIYTSGTTGRPKGAMLSHRNLSSNVAQARAALYISESDVFLTVLPLFHSFSGTVCMNIPMMTGSQAVLMENFSAARVLEVMERHRVTILAGVPAIFQGILQHIPDREYDLSALRMAISGGAPLPSATYAAVESRFGVPVLEGDGPTECSPATSVNPLHGVRKVGSVGIPLPGVEIAIFDEHDCPLVTDEIGEIVVRGENVMLGYLNQPQATAEAMASGWYHTGDLGKIDTDGYVFILDRKKDMIITAGLNVYPREVEDVLLTHAAVLDCAVIGLPDAKRGEEVAAVVVVRPETKPTERELAAHCREKLANYKVPRRVLFRESLPRGATGKVVKRLLKKELEMELTGY
jgi:long-chain acyl-CoA synthetase